MPRKSKKMKLPLIPLRGINIFPHTVSHFDIGREKSVLALEAAMEKEQLIFLVSQKDQEIELPKEEDIFEVGTVCRIKQLLKLPGSSVRVLVEGLYRGVITKYDAIDPYFSVTLEKGDFQDYEPGVEGQALMRMVLKSFEQYVHMENRVSPELLLGLEEVADISQFADLIASYVYFKQSTKQVLLEEFIPEERLKLLYAFLLEEMDVLQIESKIETEVKEQVNRFQKDYYLREQIRAIRKELGEENISDETQEYMDKLHNLKVSKELKVKIEKEIVRYGKLPAMSSESSVARTYLDTIFELPWNKQTKDKLDINYAQSVLEKDHYGLEKVKERILEFLAVRQISKGLKGPIICLVGPPGVGKTSIARSVARALERKFIRMSLGGVRDEAEIRGHRRTYIGAIPGRVITSIKDAKVKNPVFLFDEIDKMASDFRGDPASAMLEVLDPEQNKEFTDHYLELPFDLSKVLFITTANSLSTIPRPLLDRMEVIEVSGYTEEEKLHIARSFLIPKICKENGLTKEYLKISDDTLRAVITGYTRESGVRNLEREIGKICRKCAIEKVKDRDKSSALITMKNLTKYLGKTKFRYDVAESTPEIGSVNGMAWTQVGGETLTIEVGCMHGTGKLELTGQMGDVMKESARTGYSYLRSVADKYAINPDFYKDTDVHIHIPEGAIPKDGPSAGISMTTAMLSAVTKIPVRSQIAMTGEITLRGKVLAVGGIKEKVLAAYRAGIREIILPYENERNIEDIPMNVRKNITFRPVKTMEEVLEYALVLDKPKKVAVKKENKKK